MLFNTGFKQPCTPCTMQWPSACRNALRRSQRGGQGRKNRRRDERRRWGVMRWEGKRDKGGLEKGGRISKKVPEKIRCRKTGKRAGDEELEAQHEHEKQNKFSLWFRTSPRTPVICFVCVIRFMIWLFQVFAFKFNFADIHVNIPLTTLRQGIN